MFFFIASSQKTLSIWNFSTTILAIYSQPFEIYNYIISCSAVYLFTASNKVKGSVVRSQRFRKIWISAIY